jgi:nitrous oxidase accessory protein
MYTKNMTMSGNTFKDNWGSASFGLLLKDITDSKVENNIFVGNTIAAHVEGSDRIDFEGNTFRQNGWAIKVMANSYENRFKYNIIEGNTFDVSTNSRHTQVELDNNYWDAYDGYDLDHDGVGDVPFHPVRLFSLVVEDNEAALFLLRSFFVSALDAAEKVVPALTPKMIVDENPLMKPGRQRD